MLAPEYVAASKTILPAAPPTFFERLFFLFERPRERDVERDVERERDFDAGLPRERLTGLPRVRERLAAFAILHPKPEPVPPPML